MVLAAGVYSVLLHGEEMDALMGEVEVKAGELERFEFDASCVGELVLFAVPTPATGAAATTPVESRHFDVLRGGESEPFLSHLIDADRGVRLFLVEGDYVVRVGGTEHEVRVVAGEPQRLDI